MTSIRSTVFLGLSLAISACGGGPKAADAPVIEPQKEICDARCELLKTWAEVMDLRKKPNAGNEEAQTRLAQIKGDYKDYTVLTCRAPKDVQTSGGYHFDDLYEKYSDTLDKCLICHSSTDGAECAQACSFKDNDDIENPQVYTVLCEKAELN